MHVTSAKIKLAIKELLKKGGHTYEDLANVLEVSLPTVRRFLTKEDIGLDRLAAICDWLGISLEDLAAMASRTPLKLNFLTEQQEDFFASYPDAYTYLRYLGRGMTTSEIEERFNISPKSTKWYLTELQSLDVIDFNASGHVRLKIPWPTNWRFPGQLEKKFGRAIYRAATDHLLEKVAGHNGSFDDANFFLMLDSIMVSDRTYNEYLEDLRTVYRKFAVISRHELKTIPLEKLSIASVLHGIDRADFITEGMAQVKERK